MDKKELKRILKKTWWFIWEDDSIWSWIVNVILAFILIKFIVYPGLGFALGTTHPVVAVVSGSMEHMAVHPCISADGISCTEKDYNSYMICGKSFSEKQSTDFDSFWKNCGQWYESRSITKDEFSKFSMRNGFNTGDIIVLLGKNPKDIKIGDIIVFKGARPDPIIHRVINKTEDSSYFTTKGDHNADSGADDRNIRKENIIGKAAFKIPYLGWLKIGFVWLLKTMHIL